MGKSRPADPSQNTCLDGGTQKYNDDAVEVRTGVTYGTTSNPVSSVTQACNDPSRVDHTRDGISIRIKCSQNPHLVQFMYREFIDASGHWVLRTINTVDGSYQSTTDPDHPNWHTDAGPPPSPYYEKGSFHRLDPDALTTHDQPSLSPGPGETWRATFKAYAICNGKVVREISWVREQTGDAAPTYSSVTVQPANQLPDWAAQQLKDQSYDAVP